MRSTGSPSRGRSKWKAVFVSLAMVFGFGLIFAFYSSFDATPSMPFERKLISRWEEKKTQILNRVESRNSENVGASDDSSSESVQQRVPLSK